jgi:hypothetical protein
MWDDREYMIIENIVIIQLFVGVSFTGRTTVTP